MIDGTSLVWLCYFSIYIAGNRATSIILQCLRFLNWGCLILLSKIFNSLVLWWPSRWKINKQSYWKLVCLWSLRHAKFRFYGCIGSTFVILRNCKHSGQGDLCCYMEPTRALSSFLYFSMSGPIIQIGCLLHRID